MKKLLLPFLLTASFASAAEPLLPDSAETPRMKEWREMKYGMFLHFGMSTFTGNEFDPGDQPSTTYAPETIDADQWIRVAKEAGMKYAVLTSKHVAGHCLWDSKVQFRGKEFDYDVATSGNKTDVVRAFVDACGKHGIVPGLYYCLLDFRNNSLKHEHQWGAFLLPDDFFQLAKDQLTELATNYPEVRYYWLDIPRAASPAQRAALYDMLRRLNPKCVVLFNQGFIDPKETQNAHHGKHQGRFMAHGHPQQRTRCDSRAVRQPADLAGQIAFPRLRTLRRRRQTLVLDRRR